jgi:flagellar basal-body rod protein FlgG
MIDGLGAAISGITAQTRRMDALANDAANVNTAGYKPQGALQSTDQPLDVAIEGDGFFQVSRPGGQIALVRAGAFSVDASGQVVTATGDRLFPPLTLPPGTDERALAIDPSGVASVNGQQIGQVQIVTVPAHGGLLRESGGVYSPTAASGAPVVASGARVRQGALEASGVDLAENVVDTMATRTAFTAAAGSLHAYDEMFGALMAMAAREEGQR